MSGIIVVIGDSMLDVYECGEVTRISPEAPVPIVKIKDIHFSAGGAANVAVTIQSLGAPCVLFSPVGADTEGRELEGLLRRGLNVGVEFTFINGLNTTLKRRIMAGSSQLMRTDRESDASTHPAYCRFTGNLATRLSAIAKEIYAVVVSDYDKGAVSREVVEIVEKIIEDNPNIKLFLDVKPSKAYMWSKPDYITPNFSEACQMVEGVANCPDKAKIDSYCEALASDLLRGHPDLSCAVVTRAQHGCSWAYKVTGDSEYYTGTAPACTTCKTDVVGAGDTFISGLVVALNEDKSFEEAIAFASAAAALAVSKPGTTVVHRMELDHFMTCANRKFSSGKVMSFESVVAVSQQLRNTNDKVLFANGCFDLLHAGHIHLLEQAKFDGGYLIVGVTNDAGVTKLKGPDRPFVNDFDRARTLAALECVDAVVIFDQSELEFLIKKINPDYLIKGGEYRGKIIPGADHVTKSGGQVLLIDMADGKSTTGLVSAIKKQV